MTGGRFQMFDYGPQINLKRYNSTVPPEYEVKRISVPVHLFVGTEDIIADPQVFFVLYTYHSLLTEFLLGCTHIGV